MKESQEAYYCWARIAVRAMLVRVLMNASADFALLAKKELRRASS